MKKYIYIKTEDLKVWCSRFRHKSSTQNLLYYERQGKFDNFQYTTAPNQKRAPSCFSKEKEAKLSEGKKKPLEIKNEKCCLCEVFFNQDIFYRSRKPLGAEKEDRVLV